VDEDVDEQTASIPDRGRAPNRQPEDDDDAREATRKEDAVGDQDRPGIDVYDEGNNIIVENEQGDVIAVEKVGSKDDAGAHAQTLKERLETELEPSGWSYKGIKHKIGEWRAEELEKRKDKHKSNRRHEPARAYQFGNTVSGATAPVRLALLTVTRSLSKTKTAKSSKSINCLQRSQITPAMCTRA
jgi:hypothetical protein